MKKRMISTLLALCMVICLLPADAFATERSASITTKVIHDPRDVHSTILVMDSDGQIKQSFYYQLITGPTFSDDGKMSERWAVTDYSYDANGRIQSSKENANGVITNYTYQYDTTAQRIYQYKGASLFAEYDMDGKVLTSDWNNPVMVDAYSIKGESYYCYEYHYDQTGYKIDRYYTTGDGSVYGTAYYQMYENDHVTQIDTSFATSWVPYTYNNAGLIVTEQTNNLDHSVCHFENDSSGKISGISVTGNTVNSSIQFDYSSKGLARITADGRIVYDAGSIITETGAIKSLYPANGSTFNFADTSNDTRMRIFFDREVSDGGGDRPELDFSVGTLEVHKASDDSLVYQVQYGTEVSLWNVDGSPTAVVLKNATTSLDYDTEYYVTMPKGFIKLADGSVSPEIVKGEWGFRTLRKITYIEDVSFTYSSSVGGDATYSGLAYSDEWFFTDSYKYNHELAQMSLGLAMAGFGSKSNIAGPGGRDCNVKKLYADLGFDIERYYSSGYEKEDDNDVAIAICSKEIVDGKGNKSTLLAVCLRGSEYGNGGWAGDFDVGTASVAGVYHNGFYKAATYSRSQIRQYIIDHGIDTSNLKIWLTGYSRSAATANLLSAQLRTNHLCEGKNIYTYTFATPNNQVITTHISAYDNIFNLINPNDIVPGVPLTQWQFGKLGTSYVFPSLRDENLNLQYEQVSENFSSIVNHKATYSTKVGTIATKSWLFDRVGEAIPTRNMYTSYIESAIMKGIATDITLLDSLFYGTFSIKEIAQLIEDEDYLRLASRLSDVTNSLDAFQITPPVKSILASLSDVATGAYAEVRGTRSGSHNINILSTLYNMLTKGISAESFKEHWAETYLAWMVSIEGGDLTLTNQYKSKTLMAKCPIDVNVYDTNGKLVAQIINDSVQEITNSNVSLAVLGKSDKVLVLPNDQTYQVELIATDDGTMEYSITENYADGTAFRTVNFNSITIKNGDKFYGNIDNKKDTNTANYALTKNDTEKIYADYDSNDRSPVSPVTPPPTGGSTGGPSAPATYSVTIPTFSEGSVAATPQSSPKGSIVTLTVTPNQGYELVSLVVTGKDGKAITLSDKGNGKYTFTMPSSDVTVSATFTAATHPSSEPTAPTENTPVDRPDLFPFTDVLKTDWFYNAVEYVFNNNLMSGTAPYTFDPQGKMNRAMVWTVLGRMSDADVDGNDSVWYAKAQEWAIANDVSDGTNPNNSISRQELMTMLWRYIGSPDATADLSKFSDNGSVADWADAAMQWAVSTGLIVGDNGHLNPTGDAKRCEVAMIFMRFCETIIK